MSSHRNDPFLRDVWLSSLQWQVRFTLSPGRVSPPSTGVTTWAPRGRSFRWPNGLIFGRAALRARRGAPRDIVAALKWLNLATAAGGRGPGGDPRCCDHQDDPRRDGEGHARPRMDAKPGALNAFSTIGATFYPGQSATQIMSQLPLKLPQIAQPDCRCQEEAKWQEGRRTRRLTSLHGRRSLTAPYLNRHGDRGEIEPGAGDPSQLDAAEAKPVPAAPAPV